MNKFAKRNARRFFAAAVAATQLMGVCAFAAVSGGGTGTESGVYWYEDFNNGITTMKKSGSGATTAEYTVADGDKAVQIKTSASGKMGYINIGSLDFSKGPLVISYDIIAPSAATICYGTLNYGSAGIALAFLPRFDNNYAIKGYLQQNESAEYAENGGMDNATTYPNGLKTSTSTTKYAAGTKSTVQVSLNYESSTEILTVKEYINGKPLCDSTGKQYSYCMKRTDMGTAMSSTDFVLRFNFGSGKTAVIDNVMIRSEGDISLPNAAWITASTGKSGVTYSDSVVYKDDGGANVSLSYPASINNITSANQYTMKKYSLANDPLLLDGETSSSNVAWSGSAGITVSGLTIAEATDEFYVLKLNEGVSAGTNFAGKEIAGKFVLLHGGIPSAPVIRESKMFDGNNEEIGLDGNKLPENLKKLTFETIDDSGIAQEDVTFSGNGVNVSSVKDGNVYTLDLSEITLQSAKKYTIKVGDVEKEYTIAGESLYATAALEAFDSADAVTGLYNSKPANITLSYDSENKRLNYENSLEATDSTKYFSYLFNQPFDFSKGSMYVSFDVILNQEIKYLGSGSYYMSPEMFIGTKNIGYMPAVETTGVRGRSSTGSRVPITDAANTMTQGKVYTISALYTYYPDENKIGVVQFVDGKRIYNKDTTDIIDEYFVTDVTDAESDISVRFNGRNMCDGGLSFDNLYVTTVNDVTIDDLIELNGISANVSVNNTVAFDPSAAEILTAPVYTNSLTKDDIKVTRYTAADKLMMNGTAVEDFTYFADDFTISNLNKVNNDDVFVIELLHPEKLTSANGTGLDVKYLKAGTAPEGLVKASMFNASGDEICADNTGIVPTNVAKIKLVFAKDYVTDDSVYLGTTPATKESDGSYVFDLSSSPLTPNTTYNINVNGALYGSFTTSDGIFEVLKPTITADGKASVSITNTTSGQKFIYLINACYNTDNEIINLVYDKITVNSNESYTFTSELVPELSGAALQKVFAWDSFEAMLPFTDYTDKQFN